VAIVPTASAAGRGEIVMALVPAAEGEFEFLILENTNGWISLTE